ncbi:MAG TPA: TylF/MycF/NovP-related O-methyltransferase [Gammaproteobacteria bacterium]|nr:TylF/MycF/NovP-related O-methyltransferase [Gammaproteobacteria bacterium]
MKKNKVRRGILERLFRRFFYKYYARNLLYELQLRARKSSADYVEAHMQDAVIFWTLREILEYCVVKAPKAGLMLEFGVAGGKTINTIAAAANDRKVHGFDSFEGLPENWSGHVEKKGSFSRLGELPDVSPNVELHKGWFTDSIPAFLGQHPEAVAFLHIDCDLYQSTRDVLWQLADRLVPGTVIEFDEYFNYPNWQQHEYRAWQEFVQEFNIEYRYLALTASEGRVAVQITGR